MITTHVLDIATGRPAKGVPVELERAAQESIPGAGAPPTGEAGRVPPHSGFGGSTDWQMVGSGITDTDGRQRELTPAGRLEPGTYRIRFQTGVYFDSQRVKGFFPVVEIQFTIEDGAASYHVPLLLSPYGYSTYRGS